MSRSARSHGVDARQARRPDCDVTGKRCYSHDEAARKARAARRREHGEIITEYRCEHCGWWHYGHELPRGAKRRRRTRRR